MSFRIVDLIGEDVLNSNPHKTKNETGMEELIKTSSTSAFAQETTSQKQQPHSSVAPVNQKTFVPFLNQSTMSKLNLSSFDDYASQLYSNMYYEQLYIPGLITAANADISPSYPSIYSHRVHSRWPGLYSTPPQTLAHHHLSSFFHSPLEHNHYSKRKGGQVRFTTSQTEHLEKRFQSHKYLSPDDRRVLAESLKLSDRQVKTWFQNRRAKWRRCHDGSEKHSESHECSSSDSESEQIRCLSPDQINTAN